MTLSTPALRLLSYLPPYWGEPDDIDPLVVRLLNAVGDEVESVRELLRGLRDESVPGQASDTFGGLSRWERILRLPVQPVGLTGAERGLRVAAALQSVRVLSGEEWTAIVARIVESITGDPAFVVYEHAGGVPNVLTVQVPYVTYPEGLIAQVQRFTPANQLLALRHTDGWLAGISRAGDAC